MRRKVSIDWLTVSLFLVLAIMGWFSIYSTSIKDNNSVFDFSTYHGRQMAFMGISFLICAVILMLDTKFVEFLSYILYGSTLFLMILAAIFARSTHGASAWFQIGGFGIQPTELAKVGTLMALAKYMSRYNFSMKNPRDMIIAAGIAFVPLILALAQNDAGSAIVFFSLIFMFYREGLHPLYLLFVGISGVVGITAIMLTNIPFLTFIMIGIFALFGGIAFYLLKGKFFGLIILMFLYFSTITVVANNVLKPYQKLRLRVLIASDEELKRDKEAEKVAYHLRQSMVAIGSGGLWGKGYGNATHTKGDFVPEEHTDYIYCVVGEEQGWIGSTAVLILFLVLLWRIMQNAENSKSKYARIYGYGAASILFFHIMINVGMTIGLVPTVGIPLPFFSYGGSSMMGFSIMLFILINLHSYRVNILGDKAI